MYFLPCSKYFECSLKITKSTPGLLSIGSDHSISKYDYREHKNNLSEKKMPANDFIWPVKWTSKPEIRQSNKDTKSKDFRSGMFA